jgi:hypothetical protein
MDEPSGSGIVPDSIDEHSAVMTMLASDSWQKRLDEARKARETVLAQRGVMPDLPAGLRAVAPHLSGPPAVARAPQMPSPYPPKTEGRGAEDPEAEEEFPEFFPDAEDPPPVLRQEQARTTYPWAHVPPVGPARAAEPASPAVRAVTAPEPAPQRRQIRIAAGFALGLAAGVAATSMVWLMTGKSTEPVIQTGAVIPAGPAITPQTPHSIAVAPPSIRVSAASAPPTVTSVLVSATGLPGLPPSDPGIPRIQALASLVDLTGLPGKPAPPGADLHHLPDTGPALRPALQVSVPDLPFASAPEKLTMLPASFARPAPQEERAAAAARPPDPAPSAMEPPPGPPQATLPDPIAAAQPVAPPGAIGPQRVNVMAPETVGAAELTSTIASLQDAGFTLGETDRVPFKVSESHVRFYHDGDKALAEALAAQVDGEARDFTAAEINPPDGLIELWLEGGGTTQAATKPARKPARPQTARAAAKDGKSRSEDAAIRALRDKIVRQLQKGEHL